MKLKSILLYCSLFSGLGVFSFFLLVNYSDLSVKIANTINSLRSCLFFIVIFNILGYFTLKISTWLNNQYALNIKSRSKIICIYALVMFSYFLLNYGFLVIAKWLIHANHPFTIPHDGIRILIIVWLVELVVLGLLLANRSIQDALKLQQQTADLQKENNIARYTALQNQLNPHFLFNSLNTLIAEIEYNPSNAVHFTQKLSDVYRYVLQCQDKPLVSLREEIEFMQAYLFLHQVRLNDCIHCQIDIPPDSLELQLPPLTLQLLIENVIKHNSITTAKPMRIDLHLENNFLVISNPIHPKKSITSAGVGLQNLSKRCKLISGKDIQIEKNNVFTIKIPLCDE